MVSVIQPPPLIIRTGAVNVAHNAQVSQTFDQPFPTECVKVVASCQQLGFGAPSTITVGDVTSTGFKVHQFNTASATMTVGWIAVGY